MRNLDRATRIALDRNNLMPARPAARPINGAYTVITWSGSSRSAVVGLRATSMIYDHTAAKSARMAASIFSLSFTAFKKCRFDEGNWKMRAQRTSLSSQAIGPATAGSTYLCYALITCLQRAARQASLAAWLSPANAVGASLLAGHTISTTCTTISHLSFRCVHRVGHVLRPNQSSLPTTGRIRFRSPTPSFALSKGILQTSWMPCSVRCHELRSIAP